MVLNDDGDYVWVAGLSEDYDKLLQEHVDLLREWNKFVPEYNAVIKPRDIGRRPAASGRL
jgi:hypothetical protein